MFYVFSEGRRRTFQKVKVHAKPFSLVNIQNSAFHPFVYRDLLYQITIYNPTTQSKTPTKQL